LDERDVETDQSGYSLWNAGVSWERVAGSKVDVRLWGSNLTDKEYLSGTVSLLDSPGTASVLWGAPRTFGLDVSYRFGQ
jgi:iron complex outermembrane receptor protein